MSETEKQRKSYVKGDRRDWRTVKHFNTSLNLVQNAEGIYECQGRIQGSYPIYLPKKSLLSENIIWAAYKKTMHGGVTITMTIIRRYYWILSLTKITKSVLKNCHHCVRYRAMPFPSPKPGPLPKQRI